MNMKFFTDMGIEKIRANDTILYSVDGIENEPFEYGKDSFDNILLTVQQSYSQSSNFAAVVNYTREKMNETVRVKIWKKRKLLGRKLLFDAFCIPNGNTLQGWTSSELLRFQQSFKIVSINVNKMFSFDYWVAKKAEIICN